MAQENKFLESLIYLIDVNDEDFDMTAALDLSDEIDNAESNGYVLSDREDRLWKKLTDRIYK